MGITKQTKIIILGCGAVVLLIGGYFGIQWLIGVLSSGKEHHTSQQTTADAQEKSTDSTEPFEYSFIDSSNEEFRQFRDLAAKPVKELIQATVWETERQRKRADKYMDDLISILVLDTLHYSTYYTSINDALEKRYNSKFYKTAMLDISEVKLTKLPIGALRLFKDLTSIDITKTGIGDGEIEKLRFMNKLEYINACENDLTKEPDKSVFSPSIYLYY